MNPFEQYLVELLQGYVTLGGSSVEVRREFLPRGHIPCITLDIESDKNPTYRRSYIDGTDTLLFDHICDINIHTWCNRETERESINQQVRDCYIKYLNHHYRYCSNYIDGNCTYLKAACEGITAYKNKCPDPDTYMYECLSDKHGIMWGTVNIESPIFSDELSENPPILHSIIRATARYTEVASSQGETTDDYIWGELEII